MKYTVGDKLVNNDDDDWTCEYIPCNVFDEELFTL